MYTWVVQRTPYLIVYRSREDRIEILHIYLPDSMTTWIYLNLDTDAHDFKFWMAHELGHVFSPDLRGEPAEDFADAFAGANANFNKRFMTISGSLFDGKNPGAADYINVAGETFKTSFFDVLKKYLVEHGNSTGFIQSILDIPLIDAKELYAELS